MVSTARDSSSSAMSFLTVPGSYAWWMYSFLIGIATLFWLPPRLLYDATYAVPTLLLRAWEPDMQKQKTEREGRGRLQS